MSLCGLTAAPVVHAQSTSSTATAGSSSASAPTAAAKPSAGVTAAGKADAKAPAGPDRKTRDTARKAYGQGEKSFASGDFAGAYTAFAQANELIPSPHAQYWMAKSLDQQGKAEEAVAAYQAFLASPDSTRAGQDKISESQLRIEQLRASLMANVVVESTPPGAVVSVDGKPQPGTTPLALKLTPGPHRLTVSITGYETREVDLQAKPGETSQQRIELVAVPPPPPPPPPAPIAQPEPTPPPAVPEKRSMAPAFVTLGIAGAGAVVGTIFGIKALNSKSDYKDQPTASHADDTERNALIADMAFGVAITLGVTGIVLLTSSDEAPKETTTARAQPLKLELNPYAGPTGGGASARLRF